MGTRAAGNEIPISPPPWTELPGDVTANILRRLDVEEIIKSADKVCTTWNKVCRRDPSMWRVVDLKNRCGDDRKFDLMCRCAVDRSQGQLIDLSIFYFGDNDLLNYVAQRSSNLRHLLLGKPVDVSAFALTEAVRKLPNLEELELFDIPPLDAKYVEAIGISCPLLRLFTYKPKGRFSEHDDNAVAIAVAKNMPNMRHLRLIGDGVHNEGLEAILDSFPDLELLDLWGCNGLDLQAGGLGKRCSKQIKLLRLPMDPYTMMTILYND